MKHLLIATTAGLLALSPGLAAVQSAEPPRVEIGAQVSGQTAERSAITWTPRLTLNFVCWSARTSDWSSPTTPVSAE